MSGNINFNGWINDDGSENYKCRAWVNFNGTSTVAIRASGNVSSITDNGTGDYTVNFATAMPDNDYAASATCVARSNASTTFQGIGYHSTDNYTASTYSTTAVRLIVKRADGATLVDVETISVIIFR